MKKISSSENGLPTHPLVVHQFRRGLPRTRERLDGRQLTVGFIGGSITDGRSQNRWPDPVMAWLVETLPEVAFTMENAGIGATGSPYGALRARRHLLDKGCDLVFVEYAVNDFGMETELRNRTREGLIRQLLGAGIEVVIVYTFSQPMYEEMIAGKQPASIAEFEVIADHYGIGSVWMGLQALNDVCNGHMRWDQWLPDGIHPTERGSLSYAQAVTTYLQRELIDAPSDGAQPTGAAMPSPLFEGNWEDARVLPWDAVETEGPWILKRFYGNAFADLILSTSAPGARLSFAFEGTEVAMIFDFGRRSGENRYRIDDGPWQVDNRERPEWIGDQGWHRISILARGLEPGTHRVELIASQGGPGAGSDCNIVMIGIRG